MKSKTYTTSGIDVVSTAFGGSPACAEGDPQDVSWGLILGQGNHNKLSSCAGMPDYLAAATEPAISTGGSAKSAKNKRMSLTPALRRLLSGLVFASATALSACNGVGIDLTDKFQSIATGDARSTVVAKMSSEPVCRETASVVGLTYERLQYLDARNTYAVVLVGGITAAKFSQPRR